MQEADIDAWMARLSKGDRDAFGPLYAELAPRALRFSLRRLERADAEDAAQSALMKVFARASEFTPGRAALPWFYAVVFNEVTAIARRKKPLAAAELLERLPSTEEDAATRLEEGELLRRLAAAIDELDPASREAVLARLDDGNARQSPALRKRISRAYGRLRLLLGGGDD